MRLLLLTALAAMTALAADISGTWKGSAETPNGTVERTFVLKAEGAKLTGETTSQMFGKSELMNGKIDGDNLTFTIKIKFQDNEVDVSYKGKVMGDQIKFTAIIGGGDQTIEYVAKKVS